MKNSRTERMLSRYLLREETRTRFLFLSVYLFFGALAVIMTVIDLASGYSILSCITLGFALLTALGIYLLLREEALARRISKWLFAIEIPFFLVGFLLFGEPGGFAAVWSALVPFAAVLLFRRRGGIAYSVFVFLILAFFFWIPAGRALLDPNLYSKAFCLRFPVFYLAAAAVSLFLDLIRSFIERELLKARNNYRRQAVTDTLTGLGNETAYYQLVQKLEAEVENGSVKFSVAVMDVNGLKLTDDTLGHRYGCYLIVTAGHRLPDLFPGCHCFHVGGDEFVVIATGDASRKMDDFMENFYRELSYGKLTYEGKELVLSVAGGHASSTFGESYGEVFQRADDRMYENKKIIKEKYGIGGR